MPENKSLVLTVQEDPETKDLFLEFPDDFMTDVGWNVGDTIEWEDLKDGSWSLKKKETK